jgi:hypothetical protein
MTTAAFAIRIERVLDLNQYGHLATAAAWAFTSPEEPLAMSEIIKTETISRRSAFSLFGKAAAFAIAATTTALVTTDAEAQTVGMTRRQERRTGRHERRETRRTGRHERREHRRTGTVATPQ